MIYKKRNLLSFNSRKNLYFSLIYSRIIYGIEVYESATKTALLPLCILCNRALRALQNKHRFHSVSSLYINFNTLSVHNLFCFSVLILAYKCRHMKSSLPPVVCSLFTLNTDVHDYNTRS